MQQKPKSAAVVRQQPPAPHVQPAAEHELRRADVKAAKVSTPCATCNRDVRENVRTGWGGESGDFEITIKNQQVCFRFPNLTIILLRALGQWRRTLC